MKVARAAPPVSLFIVGVVLASCTVTSGSQHPPRGRAVISPPTARRILARDVVTNNRANATLSRYLLSSYESGSAFRIDEATYRGDRDAHYLPPQAPFGITLQEMSVPRQSSYPAQFVVEGLEHSLLRHPPVQARCGSVYVFERSSPAVPWRVALEPETDPGALGGLARGRAGFAPVPSRREVRLAAVVPGELAKAFLREETTGSLGRLRASDFTGQCWQVPDPRADLEQGEASGYDLRELISPGSPADAAVASLTGGRTLVVLTLRFEEQITAPSATDPISWTHPPLSSHEADSYTYFLRAGQYSEVDQTTEVEVAADVGSTASQWRLVGGYEGVVSVTGTRMKKASTTPGTLASYP